MRFEQYQFFEIHEETHFIIDQLTQQSRLAEYKQINSMLNNTFNSVLQQNNINYQQKEMHQHFWNSIDQRKDSSPLTYDCWNQNKYDTILDNDNVELPQPQLKNMMSFLSENDIEEPNSPTIMKFNNQNQVQEMNSDANIKLPNIQIQDHQKADDPCSHTLEQRSRRIRKNKLNPSFNTTQDPNQESDLHSQQQEPNTTPCKCTKSNCLKLYCQCFHQNRQCTELCKCFACKNCDDHLPVRQTALEKLKQSLSDRNMMMTYLIDQESGAVNVKNPNAKNYCECYIRNQKCSSSCRCKDCANKKRIPVQLKKKKIETVSN